MKFNIKPLEGTDILKLGLNSEQIQNILNKTPEKFCKSDDSPQCDDYYFCHIFYDKNGKSEGIEFFEPSQVVFKDTQLIDASYEEIKTMFESLDSKLVYDEGCGFVSVKYQIGIYAPYGSIESVFVAKDGYYNYDY